MKSNTRRDRPLRHTVVAAALALATGTAAADAITDWNLKANELIAEARLGTPPAVRIMAIVQTAAYDAATAAAPRGAGRPSGRRPVDGDRRRCRHRRGAPRHALPADAGAAGRRRGGVPGSAGPPGRRAGEDGGRRGRRAGRGRSPCRARRRWRRDTGNVPSAHDRRCLRADGDACRAPVAAAQALADDERGPVPARCAAGARQQRLGAPSTTRSARWAARAGSRRSAEQTEIARFWEYSLPAIYHGVVQSVALAPGRDVAQNARLYAAMAQAMDDALISVFEAKYHYQFWRPVTAIRNGDIDGNDATVADAGLGAARSRRRCIPSTRADTPSWPRRWARC